MEIADISTLHSAKYHLSKVTYYSIIFKNWAPLILRHPLAIELSIQFRQENSSQFTICSVHAFVEHFSTQLLLLKDSNWC